MCAHACVFVLVGVCARVRVWEYGHAYACRCRSLSRMPMHTCISGGSVKHEQRASGWSAGPLVRWSETCYSGI